MTALPTNSSRPARTPGSGNRATHSTVDVFGVAWPLYKVEALAAGLVAFVVVLTLTALAGAVAPAPAILSAAGVTAAAWCTLRSASARR
ncbi:hypothetical protein P0W64_21910 [Tsukamurella sp. 8F]|uniref:hypothetical protein n=1 Tax=unclassified Tsukamurella TaxID=2633480 RepID=UPI0023B917D1|nr:MULTISPECIES: hypothetical protein [unclassified Tsukamurella]MDF0532159.1 hypothetical protein [Tsukamurella sp. 8J]MDF0589443.1 hypothetical protein [Tsukamurella sp. 8F]